MKKADQYESLLQPIQSRYHGTIVDSVPHDSKTNAPLKSNGKGAQVNTDKATNLERETLVIVQLEESTKLSPPYASNYVKRIGKLKMKSKHFDNLQLCVRGVGDKNPERTVINTS